MTKEQKRGKIPKKRYTIPLVILLVIVIARLMLPYFLKKYVNKTLNNIPGYEGHVEDIDVALYRGAYVIKGLILRKENARTSTPLLDFPKSDISIEWHSLLHGKIVSEIEMSHPKFNYIFEDQQHKDSVNTSTRDWTRALKDLVPFDINHLAIHQGQMNFVQFSSDPKIDMFLDNINLQATNLSNVVNKEKVLPSHLDASAVSMGNGKVSLKGNMNLLRRIPNMDMDFSLKKADVTAINDITEKYAGLNFKSGTFELYSEVAIADGYLKGYLKPMFINATLLGNKDEGFFKKLWEGFVGMFKFLLENHGTDTLATKVPLNGDLNKTVDAEFFPTVFNIFKNGWIKAFKGKVDADVSYKDAKQGKKSD